MNKFSKLLVYTLETADIRVSRWLRSFTEKPSPALNILPPNTFDEAVYCMMELINRSPVMEAVEGHQTEMEGFVTAHHHGLGRTIRNEWKLWKQYLST